MKKRFVKLGAALCASMLLAASGAAEEKHIGNLIYVPAMTVKAQAGMYSLRVEGLSLQDSADDPMVIEQLAGAQFGVYVFSAAGDLTPWANPLYPSEPMRIRTGDGETRFSLPQGTEFFLRQESAPEGYSFDAETLIPVTDGEMVVRNAMAGELLVLAADTLGQPVAGAVFTVTDAQGVSRTLTADENGEAAMTCEAGAVYTVTQSALPEGAYKAISVQAGRASDVVAQDASSVTVQVAQAARTRVAFEHPAAGTVQLNMTKTVLGEDGQSSSVPLPGVRMQILAENEIGIVTDENGAAQASLLEGEYIVRFAYDGDAKLPVREGIMRVESGSTTVINLAASETTGRIMVTAELAKVVPGGSVMLMSDETGENYGPYALDQDGIAVSDALMPGLYHVNVKAPDQTQLGSLSWAQETAGNGQELLVEVSSGSFAQVQAQLLREERQTYMIMTAQIAETGETVETALGGQMHLQLIDENGVFVADVLAEDGMAGIGALTGTYTLRLEEKTARKLGVLADSLAFNLPSDKETITFPASNVRVILTAADENGVPVSGAVYSVMDSTSARYEITADENGEAVSALLAPGSVTIDTIVAPVNHDAAATVSIDAAAGQAARVQMMHESYGTVHVALQMQTLDERGSRALHVLANAGVEIRRADERQEVVALLTAGEDGTVSCAFEAGEYTAVMDALPQDGVRPGEAVRFEVANMQRTDVQLISYDADGGLRVTLTGGTLTDEEMAQVRFEAVDENGVAVPLVRVGDGFYAGALSDGAYTLHQTRMPQGYTLTAPRAVHVYGGNLTEVNVPLEEYAVLSVNKTGLTFNDRMQTFVVPLTGEYGVFTMEGGTMSPYPSADAQLTLWSNVTPEQIASGRNASVKLPAAVDGTVYYIREMAAAQGFEQDGEYREVTLYAGEAYTAESTVSSDRGFFTLEQRDALTGSHVSGGEYALLDAATMEPVLTLQMGDEPYRNPMAIAVGSYVLRQTKAAPGYALSENAQLDVVIEPYLTQGGTVTPVVQTCAAIPADADVNVIRELYAAQEQGLTLISVDMDAINPGEALILPQMTLTVNAAGAERSDIKSVMLEGASDAEGGQYVARVEYCLADGGWQPSDTRMSAMLSGPTAVSLSDVEDDIRAVRVTYLNAQTGEEFAHNAFVPGRVTLDVHAGADGAVNMEAKAEFTGSFAYRQEYAGELHAVERADSQTIAFTAEGKGAFATAPAGRDGRITGMAFMDTDGNGVIGQQETGRFAGLQVSLLSEAGEVFSTCRTDGQGAYSFDSLSAGVYMVQFGGGEDVVFSSGALYSAQATSGVADTRYGMSGMLVIDGEHTNYVINAGCLYAASLSGVVAEYTADEAAIGFGGVSVEMYRADADDDEEPVVVVTGEEGDFTIGGILPGSYTVRVQIPEGYLCEQAQQGEVVREITFAQGDKLVFGTVMFEEAAGVSGVVRIDDNGDGVIAPDADALEGVTVKLLRDSDGYAEVVAQVVTGADGCYAFDQLPSGMYSVLFELPQQWAFTRYGSDSLVYGAAAASGSTDSFMLLPGQLLDGVNAGVTIPASLTVTVFKDTQYDGQKGVYEELLPGASVSLIRVEDGEDVQEQMAVTGADGLAVFENVSPGDYVLGYQLPGAWRATKQVNQSTTSYPVSCVPQSTLSAGRSGLFSLSMGQKDAKLYIGAMLSGEISGTVYFDDDANAKLGETEAGAENLPVDLLDAAGTVLAQAMTDVNGAYAFEGLAPGRYTVRFTAPQACGFSATERTVMRGGVQESDEHIAASKPIVLASGAVVDTADAGIVRLGSVSGIIWEDSNADCAMDAQEKALSGVEVALMNSAGRNILATAVTDENGRFAFASMRPGQYMLRVGTAEGYVFSGALAGGMLPVGELRDNRAYSSVFTLLGGAHVEQIGFGLYKQGVVRGMLWQDNDFDASVSGQEEGLRGAQLTLLNAEGETIAAETSQRSGEFVFEKLAPGAYQLAVKLPEGYVFTRAGGQSMADATGESEAVLSLGELAMGQTMDNLTMGALKPAQVSGVAWYDADDDGRRQVNDAGMQGLSITLTEQESGESITVYANEDGAYSFEGILPGSYVLSAQLPQGYAFARNAAGTRRVSTMPQADALDGKSAAFEVISGVNQPEWDIGVVGVGTISGYVWEDRQYNGQADSDENGVAGAVIELVKANGETAASVTSGEDGRFLIDFVRMGEYTVRVTLPDGMIFTCEGESAIAALDAVTGSTKAYSLAMGEGIEGLAIGAIAPAVISGRMYVDANENGAEEAQETGLSDAMMTLMQGGTVVATCQTDENGEYRFDTVRPGTYRVRATLPGNALFAHGTALTLADPDALEGETTPIELAMGEEKRLQGMGTVLAASIRGRAWSDENADGRISEGETALSGTMAELIAVDDEGNAHVVDAAMVDEHGGYAFESLRSGSYAVRFTLPQGTLFADCHGEADGSSVPVVPGSTGVTPVLNLAMGGALHTVNVGGILPGAIGDTVWMDKDGNGLQDYREPLVPGVALSLLCESEDGSMQVIAQTQSDRYGYYVFDDLRPGRYVVSVTLREGDTLTYSFGAPLGEIDSDVDPETGASTVLQLMSGQTLRNVDVGFTELAK